MLPSGNSKFCFTSSFDTFSRSMAHKQFTISYSKAKHIFSAVAILGYDSRHRAPTYLEIIHACR
eukprot:m.50028 g.50028  ORF g.50028 m.50028 type:complete len:64 (+) comp7487_c0_seq2:461-652(+)